MKNRKYIAIILVLLLFVTACDITFDTSQMFASKEKVPFAVVIENPIQGSQFGVQPIDIRYKATAPEGVAMVELNVDGTVLNTYAAPDPSQTVVALQYSWTPDMGGSHIIRVRVQDAEGNWSSYSDVMVTVVDDQQDEPAQPPAAAQPAPQEPAPPEPTDTPSTPYIYDVSHDVDKFYYKNGTCGPTKITISLKVSDPDKVWSVVMFTRFLDKEGEGQTKWDTGHALNPKGDDTYSITLESSQITNFNVYEFAVFRYQFVATDKNRNEVTRTEVFEDISYEICP